jgi:hypothetical protein
MSLIRVRSVPRRKYDSNKDYIVDAAAIMAKTGSPTPNLQFKVTAFMSGDLVVRRSVYSKPCLCFPDV